MRAVGAGRCGSFPEEVHDEGATADSPEQALDTAFSEGLLLSLPRGAEDTGFRRGEDRPWLAPDRSRAYVGKTCADVELWPRTTERLGCA